MNEPRLYQTRIVVTGGVEWLAYDIGRQNGETLAVIGENAVPCRKCSAQPNEMCKTPSGGPAAYPHMERITDMNNELDRLRAEERGE